MTVGTIERLAQTRVVERENHRLTTAWVGSPESIAPTPGGYWLTRSHAPKNHGSAEAGPILIMLGTASSPAIAECVAHARAGARVYVLAPSSWRPRDSALLRSPKVLIRRVAEVPASAVHTSKGAAVWMGAVAGGATPWRLRLEDEQAEALRQIFLRLFWHDAIDEAWTGGKTVAFRPTTERPFEVPELPSNAALRLVEAGAVLEVSQPGQRVLLNDGALPSVKMRRLWFAPSGSNHRSLARLVHEGTVVVWDDRALPDLATDGLTGVALLPGARARLRIVLSRDQAAEAAARLDEPAAWSFGLDVRLGDHARDGAKLWLDGAAAPRAVEREQVIELPDVQASELAELGEASPTHWPEPDPLAQRVRYGWTVVPPRVPANAKEDALIGRWQQVDADWSSRIDALRERLAATDEHRGRVGKAFSRLVGAVVGFVRTHGQLSTELTELAGQQPSDGGPAQAASLLLRLAALESRASQLRADQEDAEHAARVGEERERQEADWRGRVEAARQALPGKRAEIEGFEERQPIVSRDLAEIEEALKSADKKTRKDHKVRRLKLSDELARLERTLARSRGERAQLERQVEEPFTFKPPTRPKPQGKSSGGRFVPMSTAPATATVPQEALPEAGMLRVCKDQRYLVITTWEELACGEQAARRLRARLVAPEDA